MANDIENTTKLFKDSFQLEMSAFYVRDQILNE